jgi:hypothetical protein
MDGREDGAGCGGAKPRRRARLELLFACSSRRAAARAAAAGARPADARAPRSLPSHPHHPFPPSPCSADRHGAAVESIRLSISGSIQARLVYLRLAHQAASSRLRLLSRPRTPSLLQLLPRSRLLLSLSPMARLLSLPPHLLRHSPRASLAPRTTTSPAAGGAALLLRRPARRRRLCRE